MAHYLRLFLTYLKMGVLAELEYRANFWIQLVQTGMELALALGGLAVVFRHTGDLGGWRPPELLALLGVYFVIGGLIRTMVRPSMQKFMEDIRKGTLDFTLTKPADAQVLVSIQRFELWKITDLGVGVALLVIALGRLSGTVGLAQAAMFGLTLLSGGLIVYSVWLILATFSFWFVKVENILVIFMTMYEAARWPVTIYPPWLRWLLTFLIPVAFATTVPAEAVTGRLNGATLALSAGMAAGLLVLSRRFWLYGLRFYSGASA